MSVEIRAIAGGYSLHAPFSRELNEELKKLIPAHHRRFDMDKKCWCVNEQYGGLLVMLLHKHLKTVAKLPAALPVSRRTGSFTVLYIGRCKELGKESIARGMVSDTLTPNENWLLLFPEDVLRAWFLDARPDQKQPEKEKEQKPEAKTEYQVLALPTGASIEDVKAAYKRLVRSLHPDVNKEPDANEQFLRVRQAYDVLGNEQKKKKYDIALRLAQKQIKKPLRRKVNPPPLDQRDYRTPLRCGKITLEYTETAGGYVVERILSWDDIIRNNRTLVTSWSNIGLELDWV